MWVDQKCLTAQSHMFSVAQPNMLIFWTHIVQNPTSDPAIIWWQSLKDQVHLVNHSCSLPGMQTEERVLSIRSLDWWDHKLLQEAMMQQFQTHQVRWHKIIEDIQYTWYTTLQKFWQQPADVRDTPRNSSGKLTPCYVPRLVPNQERFLGVRLPWSRGHTVTPRWFGISRRDDWAQLGTVA